jgi:hypothetical protein
VAIRYTVPAISLKGRARTNNLVTTTVGLTDIPKSNISGLQNRRNTAGLIFHDISLFY